jgi:predicted nucleotidyltransferase
MSGAKSVNLEDYRGRAVMLAQTVTSTLTELGVTVLVTGSLARGCFGPHSDIDFLVTSCPRHLKYSIEGTLEDILGGVRFDIIYLDEIPSWKVPRFTEYAVDARHLR